MNFYPVRSGLLGQQRRAVEWIHCRDRCPHSESRARGGVRLQVISALLTPPGLLLRHPLLRHARALVLPGGNHLVRMGEGWAARGSQANVMWAVQEARVPVADGHAEEDYAGLPAIGSTL